MNWISQVLKNLFLHTDSIEAITKDFTDIVTRLEDLAGHHNAKVDQLTQELQDHTDRATQAVQLASNFKGLLGIK